MWTNIYNAKTGDRAALSRIFTGYLAAVVRFIQSEGFPEADADDIAQEVFSVICNEQFLAKVDPGKGRFRSLVLAVTKNMVLLEKRRRGTLKRGAGRTVLSVEAIRDQGIEFDIADSQQRDLRDMKFDTYWIQSLVARAMKTLKEECAAKKAPFYEALDLFIAGKSYEQVAKAIGSKEDEVRSYIHQARTKLKKLVEKLIMEYSVSVDEYEKELDYLWKLTRR
jgi:RNA polymerase sigma-70 factor (ECF subfamily)